MERSLGFIPNLWEVGEVLSKRGIRFYLKDHCFAENELKRERMKLECCISSGNNFKAKRVRKDQIQYNI